MRHTNENFTISGLEEWLFYFDYSGWRKSFSIVVCGADDQTIEFHGKFNSVPDTRNVEFWIEGMGVKFAVTGTQVSGSPWQRKLFGTADQSGSWKSEVQSGTWSIKPFDNPILSVTDPVQRSTFEVFKVIPSAVRCPLLVNDDDIQAVLEWYSYMPKKRQKLLPETPKKTSFEGSCRTKRYVGERLPAILRQMVILVALNALIANSYMTVDPS